MKPILFTAFLMAYCLLGALTGKTQIAKKVPWQVKQSFNAHFRNTSPLVWREIRDMFVATALLENDRIEIYFDADGQLRGTGRYIQSSALPREIRGYLASRYGDYKIKEAYEHKCSENGLSYFLEICTDKNEVTLRMDPVGQVLFAEKKRIRHPQTGLASVSNPRQD